MTAAERLTESEALAAEATEGPWVAITSATGAYSWVELPHMATIADMPKGQEAKENAAFIAHARSALPKRDAALRAVLGLCSQAVEQARDWPPNFIGRPCVSVTDLRDAIEEALT